MTNLDSTSTRVGSGMSGPERRAILDEVSQLAARLDRARERLTNLAAELEASSSGITSQSSRETAA